MKSQRTQILKGCHIWKVWEQLLKKSAFRTASTVLQSTISRFFWSQFHPATFLTGFGYGYRAEEIENLEDVYVKSRSRGGGSQAPNYARTSSLSSGYYDAYFKKVRVKFGRSLCKIFAKVFWKYDLILGPTAIAYDSKQSKPRSGSHGYLADLDHSSQFGWFAGHFDPSWLWRSSLLVCSDWPHFDEETIYQVAAAFEATTDYHKQKPSFLENKK